MEKVISLFEVLKVLQNNLFPFYFRRNIFTMT